MGKDLGGVAARESRFPGVAKAAKRTGPSPSKRLPLCFPLLLLSAIWLFGGMAVGRAQEGVGGASLPAYVATKHVAVSYTDPLRSLEMLKVFGYNTTEPGKPLDVSKLPTVMVVPSTKFDQLPDETKRNFPQTETDRTTDLLVFYHRDKPEQLGILIDRMRTIVDVPARQIMIEALVLEISSSALEELGVEWELNRSALSSGNMLSKYTSGDLRIGNLAMEDGASIIDPTLDATLVDIFGEFETQLQALIVEKSARVLSRPSVLTLDNRMAYINVSERIPVAESKFSGQYFTQVSFREITAGIELAVRPRVTADGGEIGMQITASVTSRKPGADVVVSSTGSGGQVFEVARSPTISVREVKTFARIANNTPFIIGGLISEDEQETQRKVPILGDVPFIGPLFRSKRDSGGRREVIIVITPYVLPDERAVAGNLPKDVDDFDSFGAELFRDAYRIRDEDLFNLRFLTGNRRLQSLQKKADEAARMNAQLAEVYPFKHFVDGHVPGEEILVYRQIYEVLKRRNLPDVIQENRLIFLTSEEKEQSEAISGVGWLARYISRTAAAEPGFNDIVAQLSESVVERRKARRQGLEEPTKALAFTFVERHESEDVGDVMLQPVPSIELVDCPDRDAWDDLLWKLNRPNNDTGENQYGFLLRDPEDLVRLKRAVALRKTVDLNAQTRAMTLKNFSLGRILMIPSITSEEVYLVDKEVAKYFFLTEQYYRAVGYELEKDIKVLETQLENLGIDPAATAKESTEAVEEAVEAAKEAE